MGKNNFAIAHYSFCVMGTSCSLHLYAKSQIHADILAALAIAETERIEAKYSRYLQDNALWSINLKAYGGPLAVDEETAGLLDYAFACFNKSKGLFDITAGVLRRAWDFSSVSLPDDGKIKALLPLIGMDKLIWQPPHVRFAVPGMELDFGGIGKEYAVDRVAELLSAEGIEHGLIDLGGDLFALGPHPDGRPWRIGLRDPHDTKRIMSDIALSQGALATSGNYERCITVKGQRFGHIINPYNGWPVHGLSSATVIAPQCMVAGSIATIAMLKGRDGIQWLSDSGLTHVWADDRGRRGGNAPPAVFNHRYC